MRRNPKNRYQYVLELDPQPVEQPVASNTSGMIEALANLLLSALCAQPAMTSSKREGRDEQQDYA